MHNQKWKNEQIDKVVRLGVSQISQEHQEDFSAFVKEVYQHLAPQDFADEGAEHLCAIALKSWDFIKMYEQGKPKFNLFTQSVEKEGQTLQRTVIEILHDNMPFLVDSIAAFLNTKGFSLHTIFHPVLRVVRDEKGNLLSLCSPREISCTGSNDESFIRYETSESIASESFPEIQAQILSILKDIGFAVKDWQAMRGKIKVLTENLPHCPLSKDEAFGDEFLEVQAFLSWLSNHHFTFLGYGHYSFEKNASRVQHLLPQEGLGILQDKARQNLRVIFEGVRQKPEEMAFLLDPHPLIITKTSQRSTIHRSDFMDCVGVKQFDAKGNVVGLHLFLGLFTSSAYHQSALEIPLLRHKINQVLKETGLAPNWHDGKALIHILQTLPREELLESSVAELQDLSFSVLQLQERQRLSFFMRLDQFGRYLSCFVYVPKDRYSAELRRRIGKVLAESFQGEIGAWDIHLGDLAFARLQYRITLSEAFDPKPYEHGRIEKQLFQQLFTWVDEFRKAVKKQDADEHTNETLFQQYHEAFSKSYQDHFDAQEAIRDIPFIEKAIDQDTLQLSLKEIKAPSGATLLVKLYNPGPKIFLSDMLPVFEEMGLKVTTEIPYKITLAGRETPFWIHTLELVPLCAAGQPSAVEQGLFLEAFLKIWHGETESDGFNRLVLEAGLTWRECMVFRVYARYLKQLNAPFSQTYLEHVLAKEPEITRALIEFFHLRFMPVLESDREKACESKHQEILKLLEDVTNSDEDRIFRRFLNVILATVRTNFYQIESSGGLKPYLSFKFHSQQVDGSPDPLPLYEIFVYSARFEAIHLRGGKVARGGIRWSDRPEDYRTELHNLWKTQTVKNAVIVPVGSKGAFVVKKADHANREALMEEGVACYQHFMQAMLSLTDNWVKGKLVRPDRTVCHDDADPYLVVAADKGTATFSDIANGISAEFNFWLGDAFASGGSVGYDHKKMGITARGAWKSVEHHFKAMDIDVAEDPISVVGVGDMSGDVFGNGMLLSKSLKLIGAFNHQHIFVDPNPDPAKSFAERKRLFQMKRSTWLDYREDLISKGGGVFERSAKKITLSPEACEALGINQSSMTPQELIRCLLKAPVDLLWFGGIGTMVKASNESNSEIGDKANEACRVDASELQAKVIAEGANLGLTQKGRIEFALKGGRINTDALDNSAGVDCSDHEVNIKIALQSLLEDKTLEQKARSKLLENMTDEVAQLVLKDNYNQNQAVFQAQAHGPYLLEEDRFLIQDLERLQGLNRAVEQLPDEAELSRRQSLQMGLTRPELSVLLAYAKIHLHQEILASTVVDDPALQPILIAYFPKLLAKRFEAAILQHALRREIIATEICNLVVNTTGPTFVFEIARLTGQPMAQIVKTIMIIRSVLQLETIESALTELCLPLEAQQQILWEIKRSLKVLTHWFFANEDLCQPMNDLIQRYRKPFAELGKLLPEFFSPLSQQKFEEQVARYVSLGISETFAVQLAMLHHLSLAGDIVQLSQDLGRDLKSVANAYQKIGELLGISWLWETAYTFPADTYWLRAAFRSIREEVQASHRSFALQILSFNAKTKRIEKKIETWEQAYQEPCQRYQAFLNQMMENTVIDLGSLVLLSQRLRQLEVQTSGKALRKEALA